MERSNFGCFKAFRAKKFLKLQFIMIAIFVMTFNICLLSVISYADTLPRAPAPTPGAWIGMAGSSHDRGSAG